MDEEPSQPRNGGEGRVEAVVWALGGWEDVNNGVGKLSSSSNKPTVSRSVRRLSQLADDSVTGEVEAGRTPSSAFPPAWDVTACAWYRPNGISPAGEAGLGESLGKVGTAHTA